MSFNNGEDILDQSGLPVRQDVCIALSFKQNLNNNSRSIHQGEDTLELVKTYGYVDFDFMPSIGPNGMMSSQKFVPNFVITHIESTQGMTPDYLMLGVASVATLNEDLNWIQAFRPTATKKNDIDYKDIGGLNIEGNIEMSPSGYGKKYDTKSKTMDIGELNSYLQRLVRCNNLVVSMDLPKAGPETWYTSILSYIMFRKDAGAINRVNSFLTQLTNGNFVADSKVPMFAEITNRIHGN